MRFFNALALPFLAGVRLAAAFPPVLPSKLIDSFQSALDQSVASAMFETPVTRTASTTSVQSAIASATDSANGGTYGSSSGLAARIKPLPPCGVVLRRATILERRLEEHKAALKVATDRAHHYQKHIEDTYLTIGALDKDGNWWGGKMREAMKTPNEDYENNALIQVLDPKREDLMEPPHMGYPSMPALA